jgi:uncharacterized membrane protein
MPFCSHCGASLEGKFCSACGRAAEPAVSPSPGGSAALTDDQAAALTYLFLAFSGALFLMWAPYNQSRKVRFHAFQSIFLTVAWLLLVFLIGLLFPVRLGLIIGRLAQLGALIGWLLLMWETYNGRQISVPIIGPLAEKQV